MQSTKTTLPVFGVGPSYVIAIILVTVAVVCVKDAALFSAGYIGSLSLFMLLLGIIFIIIGIFLWVSAVIFSRISSKIKQGELVVDGVFAWVRNPVYSAFMFVCTGCIMLLGNIFLLAVPPLFWLALTILMKHTEEKWLLQTFGNRYRTYCKKVPRCIPKPPHRH